MGSPGGNGYPSTSGRLRVRHVRRCDGQENWSSESRILRRRSRGPVLRTPLAGSLRVVASRSGVARVKRLDP